jgi:hypothetical protein
MPSANRNKDFSATLPANGARKVLDTSKKVNFSTWDCCNAYQCESRTIKPGMEVEGHRTSVIPQRTIIISRPIHRVIHTTMEATAIKVPGPLPQVPNSWATNGDVETSRSWEHHLLLTSCRLSRWNATWPLIATTSGGARNWIEPGRTNKL